jgi:acetyltransferase-like isoleucine patch superfamily enzyme
MKRLLSQLRSAQLRCRGVTVGKHCRISFLATLSTELGGHIAVGRKTRIHQYARLECYGGCIRIGDNCSINPFCILYGHGGLTVGNGVRIAAHTMLISANHNFQDAGRPIFQQGLSRKGIRVEDDVWIGAGVRILDGVTIGRGCVIGAGAVVTKSTRANGIYVGAPAKWIGERGEAESRAA